MASTATPTAAQPLLTELVLMASDGLLFQVLDGFFETLTVLNRLPHTHADDDFLKLGQRMHVFPAQLLLERGNDPLGVFFLQPCHEANQMKKRCECFARNSWG